MGGSIELYRTTRGFAEDVALRTDLETKQGYKLYAVFDTPEKVQKVASQLTGQDIKFVKHISTPETGNFPTWEIYAKPVTPKASEQTWIKCPKCGGRLYPVKGATYGGFQQYSHSYPLSHVWKGLPTCNYIAKVDLSIPKGATEIAKPVAPKLSWYSISELKQMCQQKGLSTEGSKEDLIRRLRRL